MSKGNATASLTWEQLSVRIRQALTGKLDGLYQHPGAAEAFASLEPDRQQALRLLARRFLALGLWPHVKHISNVWGAGGVGMNFSAWPSFHETLRWHREFSPRFAQRPGNDGGFRESKVKRGGLHILFKGTGESRAWDAHFDIYNPLFSPTNTILHVWNEVIKSHTPDWQMVQKWLS